jgi:hypothetical protein
METDLFRNHFTSAIFASLIWASCANADALATSTFASGTEGWDSFSFVDNGEPEFSQLSRGTAYAVTYNPGVSPYISEQDPDEGWEYFRAGPAFLGDQLAALGGTFVYSIARTDTFDLNPNPVEPPPVAIAGDGLVLAYIGPVPVPTSVFTAETIPFAASSSWVIDNVDGSLGAAATPTQFSAVLSDLTGIYILGDWFFGAGPINGDTYGIENVSLNAGPATATPEPATVSLLGGALLGLAILRKIK